MENDRYQRLRDALSAGPTPGPWYLRTNRHPTTDGHAWGWLDTQPPGGSQYAPPGLQITWERGSKSEANAGYIAAADPDTIRALLAERDALRDALVIAREYVANEIAYLRNAFRGHEELGRVPEAEADLARINAALGDTDAR